MRKHAVEEHSRVLARVDAVHELLNQNAIERFMRRGAGKSTGFLTAPNPLDPKTAGADQRLDDTFVDPQQAQRLGDSGGLSRRFHRARNMHPVPGQVEDVGLGDVPEAQAR